jgi:hypothetical protein
VWQLAFFADAGREHGVVYGALDHGLVQVVGGGIRASPLWRCVLLARKTHRLRAPPRARARARLPLESDASSISAGPDRLSFGPGLRA